MVFHKYGLGGCPRIAILSQMKAFPKNTRSHIVDIGVVVYGRCVGAYLRALFFQNNEDMEQKRILLIFL